MTRARDPRIFLLEAEKTAAKIESFAGDMDFGAYCRDEMKQRALEGGFMQLGLALNHLSRSSPEVAAKIPQLGEVVGFRNKLIHEYHRVDQVKVWKHAVDDLPDLQVEIQSLLDELDREAGSGRIGRTAPVTREARVADDGRSSAITTALHEAARAGDTTRITQLVAQGADPNARDRYGQIPLMRAAEAGLADTIRTLIELGADPNARDRYGRAPLHEAGGGGQGPEIVTILLEHGADLNASDHDGITPLHIAARWNDDPDMVARLARQGGEVNAVDRQGATALHAAAQWSRNPEIITVLIELGADLEARNENGETPPQAARRAGNTRMVQVLEAAIAPPAAAPAEPAAEPDSSPAPSM